MNHDQSLALARLLKNARAGLGLSAKAVAERAGITDSNIIRLEQGAIANPRPDTLKSLAAALELDIADVFATSGYVQPGGLPSFTPYLRHKYADLPPAARAELERSFARIAGKYGLESDGPQAGEDERD